MSIEARLAGRKLLVTGATGFLAKVFVEKLLRDCPEVEKIYLLIRPRGSGKSAKERLIREVRDSSCFDRLRGLLGLDFEEFWNSKVEAIAGDLTKERLGLDGQDYEDLANELDFIVNSAATVSFDERLDLALDLNTLGPRRLLDLSRKGGKIPLLHVSTCYVCGMRSGRIAEDLSPPRSNGDYEAFQLLEQLQAASTQELEQGADSRALIDRGMSLARKLGWNDTYTMTKWLGEQLLVSQGADLPLIILRPAIIESAKREPQVGWIDGLRMADPLVMAFGRGQLDCFPADPRVKIDFIPVDLVANGMIVALASSEAKAGLSLYQLGSSDCNPLSLEYFLELLEQAYEQRPMRDGFGAALLPRSYRALDPKTFNEELHRRESWGRRYSSLLAFLGIGKSRRERLRFELDQIEQFRYFAKIYAPYTHLDCRFRADKLLSLWETLDEEDQKRFPCDPRRIDWRDYIVDGHVPGMRRYVLGEATPPGPLKHSRAELSKMQRAEGMEGTIWSHFARTARHCGAKAALQIQRGRWTCYSWQELDQATACLAKRLEARKLETGTPVVLCVENCPEWGIVYLALQRCGLTAVPLDPQLPPGEILSCSRFVAAGLLCLGETQRQALESHLLEKEQKDYPVPERVTVAPPFVPAPGNYDVKDPPEHRGEADELASILFTSGTMLAPKAVPLTHRNFLFNVHAAGQLHDLCREEHFISLLPLYHAFEFSLGFLVAGTYGDTTTYVDSLQGPRIASAMRQMRPSTMLAVPRLIRLLYDGVQEKVRSKGLLARAVFSLLRRLAPLGGKAWRRWLFSRVHEGFGGRLERIISGGAALPVDLFRSFETMGFEICEGCELTATAPALSSAPPGESREASAGKALPGVELQLRNLNDDGVGELYARGPNVFGGYLNNPRASAEVLFDGWFRSGDLGRIDDDGYLYIVGRVKDLIVTPAGKNVYPDEVESLYDKLPGVEELCVFGRPLEGGEGEAVEAVVSFSGDGRELRSAITERSKELPAHQRIARLHLWSGPLPKTSTLKTKRRKLRELILSGRASLADKDGKEEINVKGPPQEEPLSESRVLIHEIVGRMAHRPPEAIKADSHLLLDLGLDSLALLGIVGELESAFSIEIEREGLMKITWVSEVYELVEEQRKIPKAPGPFALE